MVSVCCVPSCSSVNIKAEKHNFTWEVICDSIGIANLQGMFHCVQCIISRYIGCLMLNLMHANLVVC